MVRTTLILIVFLLMGLGVHARSYLRTYEDFVHLPQHEQDKIIIKTMELVVELESNYIKDTEIYGKSSIREEQFRKAVKKIVSLFFLNSAHAQASPVLWERLGEDFNKLMTSGASNKCIYAGWVSETKIVGNKTVCAHPSFTTKSNVNGYQKPLRGSKCLTSDGIEDPTKIQCSPLIFGYKNIQKRSLFCVSSKNGSHNSSFDCMKAALSSPPGPDADEKEKRIKFLREKIYANPAIFKNAQEFIYKACVCPNLPKDTKLNVNYHKYMQPHRTCYGLMEMMGETFTSCQNTDLQIDLSIFKSLQEHTAKLTSGGNDTETDKHYKNFVDGIAKNSPDEIQRLCNSEVANDTTPVNVQPTPVIVIKPPTPLVVVKPPTPVIVVKPPTPVVVVKPPTPLVVVKPPTPLVVVKPPTPVVVVKPPTPVIVVKPPTPEAIPGDRAITPTPSPMTNKPFRPVTPIHKLPEIVFLDPLTPVAPPKKIEFLCNQALCKKNTKDGKDQFECSYEIVDKQTNKSTTIKEPPANSPQKSDDTTILISGEAEDGPFTDLSCKIKWVQEGPSLDVNIKEETDTTVTVEAVAKDPGKSTIEFTFVDRPADFKDVDPPAAGERTPKDPKDEPVSTDLTKVTIQNRAEKSYQVCGVLKDKGNELDKRCVEIKPMSEGPTLQVKIIKTETTAVIIEAKVENEGDNTFSWSIKNPPAGITIAKGWETKTESKKTDPPKLKGGAQDAKPDEGEEKKDEKKAEEKPAVISDNKIITQTRLLARYQVCGTLKSKLSKEIKTGCVNVEPVAVKKDPQGQGPMNQGPPMPPLRAPSDTSAFGIR